MTPVRVWVAGASGRVGRVLMEQLPLEADLVVVGSLTRHDDAVRRAELLAGADVLVDFTTAQAAPELLLAAVRAGVRPVSGTTGLPASLLDELDAELRQRGLGGVWAANFAVGAVLMMHFAATAARFLHSGEIIELHHDAKADAPSGTAVATARMMRAARGEDLPDPAVQRETLAGPRGAVDGGVRIHSVRLPGLVGHQEVILGALGQTLTIRHDTSGREAYVPGVALAVRAVAAGGFSGLRRGIDTLMGLDGS
jgi:4-hydroxy-tetrahydrodipicolinate reductase